ncbi:hypothetical protein G6F57_022030 [Rhizopus arrhizus]|nr:hypothetical protein G6F57_022030 [Rhizopus arrhizus]
MGIDERRRELVEEIAPHVQQAGAAGAAQGLAAGAAQHVAADLRHVDGQLAHRLRAVHEKRNAVLARHAADRGRRIDQSAVGGQPGQRNQAHAFVQHGGERLRVHAAAVIRGDGFQDGASAFCP